MSEVGTLKEWGVDLYALQHFSQDPPDLPGGQLLIDGEPYPPEGGGGGSAHTIEDEGVGLPDRGTLNFVGAGVTVTDVGSKTTVTIPSYTHPNHSGDVVSTGDAATEIQAGVVTNAKLASMTAGRIKGRISTDGSPQDLTATEVRTLLNVADGANAYVHPNHSGDVTSLADGAQTIAADVVSNTKLANMAESTIKGRAASAGTGDPTDLTPAQVRTLINVADGANAGITALTGAVTASGTGSVAATIASDAITTAKILDANVTNAKLANMATKTIKGRNTGSTGVPEDITLHQARQWYISTETSNATPSINSDLIWQHHITALATAITGITVTGTPYNGQVLWIAITGTATRAITMGSSFEASTVALPTTTDGTNLLDILCRWNSATSKWRVVAVA